MRGFTLGLAVAVLLLGSVGAVAKDEPEGKGVPTEEAVQRARERLAEATELLRDARTEVAALAFLPSYLDAEQVAGMMSAARYQNRPYVRDGDAMMYMVNGLDRLRLLAARSETAAKYYEGIINRNSEMVSARRMRQMDEALEEEEVDK